MGAVQEQQQALARMLPPRPALPTADAVAAASERATPPIEGTAAALEEGHAAAGDGTSAASRGGGVATQQSAEAAQTDGATGATTEAAQRDEAADALTEAARRDEEADAFRDSRWRLVRVSSAAVAVGARHDAGWAAAVAEWPTPPGVPLYPSNAPLHAPRMQSARPRAQLAGLEPRFDGFPCCAECELLPESTVAAVTSTDAAC